MFVIRVHGFNVPQSKAKWSDLEEMALARKKREWFSTIWVPNQDHHRFGSIWLIVTHVRVLDLMLPSW